MDKKQYTSQTSQTKNIIKRSIAFNRKKNLTDNLNSSGPPNTD